MKIAIIGTRGIPANYGGFETAAEEIAVGLVRKGHKVTVYCRFTNSKNHFPEYRGVNLKYTPHIDSKNIGTLTHSITSFFDALNRDFDIFLVFNVGLAPLCLIPKILGKKVILNVDGLEWKRRKWGWFAQKYFLFCEWTARFTTGVLVTDSKAIQKYYLDKYNSRSIYIPYGAFTEKSTNPEILKKYGVKKGEYFFAASRLEPENNADLIIEAFKKLKTDKKLLIAGGANYRSDFVEKLKKIRDRRIKLLGHVYTPGHIKELHCGCFAYLHGNEVGGTNPALLKAMGYGNCILVLSVPYNLEVINNSAIPFDKSVGDLTKKIQYIIDHPDIRKSYQKNAVERVKKYYSWNKVIESYENLF